MSFYRGPGEVHVARSACPNCGHEMDMATPLTPGTVPKPGDYAICVRCGDLNQYDEKLHLRRVSTDELLAMPLEQREYLLQVEEKVKRFLLLGARPAAEKARGETP